jgi:glycosyltransferase involved in cell wall biosynthesis
MTHTLINTNSVDDAVPAIRRRKTEPAGTCRNHKAFAFEIFNGVYEEYMARGGDPRGMISQLAAHVLKEKPFSLTGKFKLRHMRKSKKVIYRMLANLVNESDKKYINADEKFDAMWTHITALTDEVIMGFFRNMTRGIGSGGPKEVLNAIPRTVASAIVYLPIIFGIKYTHKDLKFQYEVHDHFIKRPGNRNKKILWFTDTINDLNGVSVTLRNIGWLTHRRGDDVQLVASLLDREKGSHLPPNIINLESMVDFKLPYYEKLTVKVPSFFAMIDRLGKEMPDEIFISTPSVIGLYGLFFAKLFGIKCTTVYHTDFTMQAKNLIANTSPLLQLIEIYTKWFYESSDRILVPTEEYISILSKRGFDRDKMGIFYRGIDTELFSPRENAAADLRAEYGLEGGVNLLYAGRISEDKNVDFLIKAVSPLFADGFGNLNLIFVGDGPYLQTLKKRHAGNRNMVFLGEIPNHMLPTVYSGCDLLVFPSETDTFGMVVLEAQACGLPVIVSHIGGPRDILLDGTTGFVLNTENTETWTEKLKELLPLITSGDRRYTGMRERSRQHVINRYDFNAILDNFIVNDDDREKTDSDAQLRIVS